MFAVRNQFTYSKKNTSGCFTQSSAGCFPQNWENSFEQQRKPIHVERPSVNKVQEVLVFLFYGDILFITCYSSFHCILLERTFEINNPESQIFILS